MSKNKSLFDDDLPLPPQPPLSKEGQEGVREHRRAGVKKEIAPLERLKNLEDKIADAIEKVKTLKEEKAALERRVKELETRLNSKDIEIERLQIEKTAIKNQVEALLNELETIEVV